MILLVGKILIEGKAMNYDLPVDYTLLSISEKKAVREQYIKEQNGKCWFCRCSLDKEPPQNVLSKPINLKLFPKGFLNHPIHLQHNHDTGLTEGAVHAYCNAVLWEHYGR